MTVKTQMKHTSQQWNCWMVLLTVLNHLLLSKDGDSDNRCSCLSAQKTFPAASEVLPVMAERSVSPGSPPSHAGCRLQVNPKATVWACSRSTPPTLLQPPHATYPACCHQPWIHLVCSLPFTGPFCGLKAQFISELEHLGGALNQKCPTFQNRYFYSLGTYYLVCLTHVVCKWMPVSLLCVGTSDDVDHLLHKVWPLDRQRQHPWGTC